MEALFKNQTILTKTVLYEYAKSTVNPYIRYAAITMSIVFVFAALLSFYGGLIGYGVFFLVMVCYFFWEFKNFHLALGKKLCKKQKKIMKNRDLSMEIIIFDDHMIVKEILPEDKSGSVFDSRNALEFNITHNKIIEVYQTENLFVIKHVEKVIHVLDKSRFTMGTSIELEEFLLTKGIEVKKK